MIKTGPTIARFAFLHTWTLVVKIYGPEWFQTLTIPVAWNLRVSVRH